MDLGNLVHLELAAQAPRVVCCMAAHPGPAEWAPQAGGFMAARPEPTERAPQAGGSMAGGSCSKEFSHQSDGSLPCPTGVLRRGWTLLRWQVT
ncbi:uncharacterized protein LOC115309269 isoform X2 [Ixodes scapularis]|uniref:uncharacterized protein LOC115309269 isoform X2 n=1 Tax=Ixodes scapularis TaxID=6945 RepID=UPI001C37F3CE|nr:uncharacterized protein LOC115309269 isoform X2 [Ixodes scapularis]